MNPDGLIEDWSKLWLPRQKLSLSEWAEQNFILSSEYAGTTAQLTLFGWQREIFDSFTDPRVQQIVLMTGTQLVKTLFLQAALAYVIAEQPGPVLLVQPKDVDANTFSKERLSPMFRDIPVLRNIIGDAKSRDGTNTIEYKAFPGGTLSLVGANAPGNFARRTIRYLFCDETDKYQPTKEGDQISLGIERTAWFRTRRKIVLTCSPTVDGRSRIQQAYGQSDQRKPWVPCAACGQFQVLGWPQVKWEAGKPGTARYQCVNPECGERWHDTARWAACERTEWRGEQEFQGTAGFWISHLYSPVKTLEEIVAQFLKQKGERSTLQVFVNTTLAETFRDEGERPQWEVLKGRAEEYPINDEAVVPARASFLTAAVDFQREWLNVELKAWGRGKESWSLGMWRVEEYDGKGNPLQTSDPKYREWLRVFLHRTWKHESGADLPILVETLDTGERPDPVYEFARESISPAYGPAGARVISPRTVVPIKGASQDQHSRLIVAVSQESAARKRRGVRIVSVGGGYAKGEFYGALALRRNADGSYPSGYCHFPKAYDDSVFQGYCSEERVVHASGTVEWVKVYERNEPLDCHVYNRAAAELVGISGFNESHWLKLEQSFGIQAP
ncbi:MAG TPA: terminase gpA endonuclease subunit, partial [Bryobacteraceae bacterium]|nr:terminase gpA endonuclease subunit [Bryobacteraceae bacterium]